jgi:hypothetical protein
MPVAPTDAGPVPSPPASADGTPASGATWSAATTGAVPASPVATPVPATEPWVAPAPPRKRKLTWLWILLGVLALIAVLVVTAVVLFIRTISGPIDATNDVLARIKAENYPAAYALACSEDRERFTVDQYGQAFKDTVTERGRITSYDVNYSSVDGSTAEVRYDIEFANGDELRLEAKALKENGSWRACLLQN